eukprot:12058046-Prorocentrum_lima.AAC.1
MTSSLVGSEMCIRDSDNCLAARSRRSQWATSGSSWRCEVRTQRMNYLSCLLYTSDAADDM